MDSIIHANRVDLNTRKRNPTAIIVGPHRITGVTWLDVLNMAMRGCLIVRDGSDIRAIRVDADWGTA